MQTLLKKLLAFLAFLLAVVSLLPAGAAASEKRFALVVGNASYKAKALVTPVNDAALIAQTCRRRALTSWAPTSMNLLRQTRFAKSVAGVRTRRGIAVYSPAMGSKARTTWSRSMRKLPRLRTCPFRALQLARIGACPRGAFHRSQLSSFWAKLARAGLSCQSGRWSRRSRRSQHADRIQRRAGQAPDVARWLWPCQGARRDDPRGNLTLHQPV